jgi:hypothetical protein
MLFSPDGVNDDELAEILDYRIDGEEAILWCRRQDARKFKQEKCSRTGALIFSLPMEGEDKPRYYEISIINKTRPNDRYKLRKRILKLLARQIKTLVELESNNSSRLDLFPMEDEIFEIVREMLAVAVKEKGLKSA